MEDSAPPVTIMSALPLAIASKLSPMAWVAVEQAETTEKFGPPAPQRMVLSGGSAGTHITEVDYDRYAHGEAVLGWLHAAVELTGAADRRSSGSQWSSEIFRVS